ncbi:efflux RND transporter periplasmic adaptor subunit, partial [bacterium]|nr:efflux RND transporter periplasmic adaptor subunit [bacterium]
MRTKSFSRREGRAFRLVSLLLVGLVLGSSVASCGKEKSEQATHLSPNQLYTCGMHPQVLVEDPGLCPICNMKLTPLKTETTATESEHQHGEEPGQMTGRQADPEQKVEKDRRILYWRAPMDPSYIADKPGKSPMGMDLIPVYEGDETGAGGTVSIDPVTVQNIGIRTATVRREPFHRVIRSVGHIDYNEEKLFTVNLKFNGWIEKLHVNRTGDLVKKGEPLFEIYSPDLVATQEEYLLAFQNKKKLQASSFAQVTEGARSLLKAARQRLQYWDISDDDIEKLESTGEVRKTLTIHSPADGIVTHKNALEGGYSAAGQDLFRIADLSTIWVYAHIFEYELPWIRTGQKVQMELPYMPGRTFQGRVDY